MKPKASPLIRLGGSIGVVNATAEVMAADKNFQESWKPESGVFCLVPDELDIPF